MEKVAKKKPEKDSKKEKKKLEDRSTENEESKTLEDISISDSKIKMKSIDISNNSLFDSKMSVDRSRNDSQDKINISNRGKKK